MVLVAKNRENGRTPSLAISCLTFGSELLIRFETWGFLVGLTSGGCEGHDDNVT